MRKRWFKFLAVFQSIFFLGHWAVYETWTAFHPAPDPPGISALGGIFAVLSITFLTASLLAWRYSNVFARLYYKAAAAWLGFLSFFFLAAISSWIALGAADLLKLHWERENIASVLFGFAALLGVYGIVNAAMFRVKRITVKLPHLPDTWRGRVAALVTDMHLGHVRGPAFAKRIVRALNRYRPDIVLIGGDMYDGTRVDVEKLAAPLRDLSIPLGTYFVAGNHDEHSDHAKYLSAVSDSGAHVLNNEKTVVDGLQIVGVHYGDSVNPEHFRSILRAADLDADKASILLTHSPNHLPIAAEEKIGMQLSGHTHGGQFIPFTWITSRIYGQFVYGLKRLGDLLVYTSCGVGTWGPPMRVGTRPEIVLIRFEA